jgi:hypothetical protein
MAKKASKARKKTVPSLKASLSQALRSAKSLKGKVAAAAELDELIAKLGEAQNTAAASCPTKTFARAFSLVSRTSKKR